MKNAITAILLVSITVFSVSLAARCCAAQKEYRLQPEDILSITVHEQPDLTTKTRITSDGNISFPLLGEVHVAGMSTDEVGKKITELLAKDYLVNPQVIVYIDEYAPKQVSVIGCVNNPGKYDMSHEKETTVLQAIAMAGGFSKIADVNGTKILRIDENGKEQTIMIRIKDITGKGEKDKDLPLKPNDVIFVPESFF
jgi:polysaccharide export outer membrane protein